MAEVLTACSFPESLFFLTVVLCILLFALLSLICTSESKLPSERVPFLVPIWSFALALHGLLEFFRIWNWWKFGLLAIVSVVLSAASHFYLCFVPDQSKGIFQNFSYQRSVGFCHFSEFTFEFSTTLFHVFRNYTLKHDIIHKVLCRLFQFMWHHLLQTFNLLLKNSGGGFRLPFGAVTGVESSKQTFGCYLKLFNSTFGLRVGQG